MKRTAFCIALCCLCGCISAQTQVVKINAAKANDYGVSYVLPKTLLTVEVTYTETKQKAGTYAKYAARYLGLTDAEVIMEDRTFFTLEGITVAETSVPNKEQSYLVVFKAKTTSPFVCLTEDGVILTINADYVQEKPTTETELTPPAAPNSLKINPKSIYTEEYLRAGSVGKMAETAAKNIYRIRESRQDLLTGELENMPKDGEAMKIVLGTLEAQEKLWTELFTGASETVQHTRSFVVEPAEEKQNEVFFRFSEYFGIVTPDDLSGRPVTLNITNLHSVEMPITDLQKQAKAPRSIVYNVPGKANVTFFDGSNKLYDNTFTVTQFGATEILATSLFDDKKAPVRVYFYPATGAIQQIIR